MTTGKTTRRTFVKGAAAGVVGVATQAVAFADEAAGPVAGDGIVSEGEIVGVLPGYIGGFDWLGKAPVISDDQITDTISVDVVVCGGGNAGIQAALAAAEGGASVAVIEKSSADDETGYIHVWGQEVGHYNSEWLINQGYGPYNLGDIVNEFCKRGGNRVNPEIIRRYVANSGELLDHFISLIPADSHILTMGDEGELGLHVAYGVAPNEYPIERGGYKTWAGDAMFWGPYNDQPFDGVGSFSNLSEAQGYSQREAERLGAKWYFDTYAVVLTQDADGAVTGVIAQNDDDEYIKFEAAKAVVLATGDMGRNGEMVWELITEASEWGMRHGKTPGTITAMTANDGSGIKMGCWAGGIVEPGPRATMSLGGGGGGPWGTAPFLWLNADGKRYMNEAATCGSYAIGIRQPIGIIATVTDSKWMKTVQNASIDHGAPNYTRPRYYEDLVTDMSAVLSAGPEGAGCRTCTIAERNLKTVYGAEDLETALSYAGYEGEALQNALASIARYNELCYAGEDSDFGKDAIVMVPIDEPPYYVAPSANDGGGSAGLVTLSGLMTNEDMQVIRADRTVIPNLYAVGNCLGQRFGNAYSTPCAGVSIGMAMTHGRVVGKIITGQEVK